MPPKGRFITFEGGEGVGKSTLISAFVEKLKQLGQQFIATREPGGTIVAEELRKVFQKRRDGEEILPLSEFLIISAARTQHIFHTVQPALDAGIHIICDRFTDSSLVYQGIVGGLGLDFVQDINARASLGISPDITFLLDLPVEVAQLRIKNSRSEELSRYDVAKQEIHQKVRAGYLKVQSLYPERIILLDGQKSVEMLCQDAMDVLIKKTLL